jgi:predicted transcriptional regulator
MYTRKAGRLQVRTNEALDRRLDKAREVTDRPVSQIVREAITEKLDRLAKRHPELLAKKAA